MITSRYIDAFGSLGNNIFQYVLGRILSEETGMYLNCPPIPWFPNTHERVKGKIFQDNLISFKDQTLNDMTIQQAIDICKDRAVLLSGWFQQYEYYKPYKDRIREWLAIEDMDVGQTDNDIILHLRLGNCLTDYKDLKEPPLVVDAEYYLTALEIAKFDKLYLCSDPQTQDYPLFKQYLSRFEKYNPIILHGDQMEDFRTMKSFNKIIISQSTYGWWAAFLSKASEIYFPVPNLGYDGHPWSLDFNSSVNLFVDDEPRYRYLRQYEDEWRLIDINNEKKSSIPWDIINKQR